RRSLRRRAGRCSCPARWGCVRRAGPSAGSLPERELHPLLGRLEIRRGRLRLACGAAEGGAHRAVLAPGAELSRPRLPGRLRPDAVDRAAGVLAQRVELGGGALRGAPLVRQQVVPNQPPPPLLAQRRPGPDLVEGELAVPVELLLGGHPPPGLVVVDLERAIARADQPVDDAG